MNFDDYRICAACGEKIPFDSMVPVWVHDILNHRDQFEQQTQSITKDALMMMLYDIIEYYNGITKRKHKLEDLK